MSGEKSELHVISMLIKIEILLNYCTILVYAVVSGLMTSPSSSSIFYFTTLVSRNRRSIEFTHAEAKKIDYILSLLQNCL